MATMKIMKRSLVAAVGVSALVGHSLADVLSGQRSTRLRSSSQRTDPATDEQSGHIGEWGESIELPEVYSNADDVARYLEKRRSVDFATEGVQPDVDMPTAMEQSMRSVFEDTPDIFKHCVLIRDFATPLRVGSALNVAGLGRKRRFRGHGNGGSSHGPDDSDGQAHDRGSASAVDDENSTRHNLEENEEPQLSVGSPLAEDGDPDVPDLMASGGVMDRGEAPDGRTDSALLEVSMIAFLQSVAGHVSVVPMGDVAKWSSKKKVPIAGYLCTDNGDPVLYTLPSPCVPTGLADDGTDVPPPPPSETEDSAEPPLGAGPSPALAFAPAPAGPASFVQQESWHHAHHHHSHRHGRAHHTHRHVEHMHVEHMHHHTKRSPKAAFGVYVGSLKLQFSSKKKADYFCQHLTKAIAEDPGDNEWDTEHVKSLASEPDMPLSMFVQLARKDPPEAWTTGTKKVLVIIMDWQSGDRSKAPLSSQTLTPQHVKDNVFPKVKKAFEDMSWGKFAIEYDVVPEVIRYTKPRSRYTVEGYPFPGLYNGAVQSLEGNARWGNKYNVADYDLVYTMAPQQAPVGTKGVAWVGAKGAMCNGCEAVSESMQVMVAVHELGHNLGLAHASSSSLEYGNPFDWMGNYPDVQGLSYGMGYKLKLHWLPRPAVAEISDASLPTLNDRYILSAFDAGPVSDKKIVGVQLSLKKNPRDIFVSYRKTAGKEAGVYVVFQDRERPDSELIDMGCHTMSQKDARLRPGWTYVEPSSQVVIVVEEVTEANAKVHIYRAPGNSDLAAIRAREKYSDGKFKCPRTCQDSDLLIADIDTCPALAKKGYCKTGSITMGGKTLKVGKDLCPESCDACDEVLSGSAQVGGKGCADSEVKINGMSCVLVAARGHCEATTNMGHVGRDLCPRSCGHCPPQPSFVDTDAGAYKDPTPARTFGDGTVPVPSPPPAEEPKEEDGEVDNDKEKEDKAGPTERPPSGTESEEDESECYDVDEWKDSDGDGCSTYRDAIAKGQLTREQACSYGNGEAKQYCRKTCQACTEKPKSTSCEDDPEWKDADGDSCKVYHDYIRDGMITRSTACAYANGEAAEHCRKTCRTCADQPEHSSMKKGETCEDEPCVSQWLKQTGQCFLCSDWPVRCNEPGFARDCPRTCGTCTVPAAVHDDGGRKHEAVKDEDDAPKCEDDECIEHWREAAEGKCLKCKDFASQYCGNDRQFMEACPKTCKLCTPDEKPVGCHDLFEERLCTDYKKMGWCSQKSISDHCMSTCGLCKDALEMDDYPYDQPDSDFEGTTTTSSEHAAARGLSSGALALLAAVLGVMMTI